MSADLSDLFARLNQSAQPHTPSPGPQDPRRAFTFSSPLAPPQPSSYRHPSLSSPISSPPPSSQQPPHPDHIMTLSSTPASIQPTADQPQSERTNNLLNLLKFNPSTSATASKARTSSRDAPESRAPQPVSASDLVADFGRRPSAAASTKSRQNTPEPSRPSLSPRPLPKSSKPPSSENPQKMLLSLLKSPASDGKAEQLRGESQLREITPAKVFGHSQDRRSPSFHAPQPAPQATNQIFNYVNPFEKLEESSSSHRSSQLGKKPALERADEPADQIRSLARAPTETVSEALNEVADQADKQVQDVLGPTKELASSRSDPKPLSDIEATQTEIKEAVHDAATELCDELKDGKTRKELEKTVPKPVASALQDTAEKIAHEDVADSWENANGVSSATRVFNFPMRPFVSIDVKSTPEIATPVRDEVIMKIASLKKEFDQIDRTLATASPHFIVYAMTKGGGFRVIRQEDGTNKSVFRGSNNQVFNVSASAAANELEVVLATGVNGSVFWTSMPVDENQFREGNLEQRGFVMPPGPSFSDNTSNAQLKTRAKLSCKHVELFAFGRGKNIHLICPFILSSYASEYVATSTREVDTQKYLKEHSLKIATGKAAKDFTFSTDDSAIVTLDKHGWLKFWDLAPIYESLGKNFSPKRSVEVSEPSLSLLVGSSNAKAWPTSVQFVDKDYPISRSQAMRYLLVGLKQNHTVQLWDLALGKAVQELNLPHESETDAICSISYHAKSTIIAIGHPTRNSIFLIHLSAPRYTLPPMNQATYIQRLSQKDGTIPRPDSTAIMSGIREISMSPIGHLRSIDILPPTQMTSEKDAQGDETVFEVYALHSRGVTCMNLKKQDFGWDAKGKVADPNDAQEEGLISIRELQATPAEDISKTSDSSSIREQVKKESEKAVESSRTDDSAQVQRPSETSGQEKVEKADKAEKKKKKKQQQQQQQQEVAEERSGLRADKDSSLNEASRESPSKKATQSVEPLAEQYATQPDFPSRSLDLNGVRSDAASVSAFAGLLNEQLTDLYRRFDEDKRVQEASGAAKQDAILRLVSSTLTENVEKSLTRIITSNVRESVQPSIDSIAADAFQKELPKKVSQQVGSILPNELKAVLSEEVSKALKDAAVLRSISDLVSSKIGGHVEKQFKSILENNFVPRFKNLAAESARKSVAEIEKRVNEQMKVADAQRQGDSAKIDHLTKLTRDLSETVQNMAKAQSDFQKNLLVTQEEMRRQDTAGGQSISTTLRSAPASENPKDVELDTIQGMMLSGKVEDGTIRWLQSERQDELFGKLFVQYDPKYLKSVNQIITLSVSHAVSLTFDSYLMERLGWLEVVLKATDSRNPEISQYAPGIMDVLVDRLVETYMKIADMSPGDPVLARIHALVRQAKELKAMAD